MTGPTTVRLAGSSEHVEMRRIAGLQYEELGRGDAVLFVHGGIVADLFAPMIRQPSLHGYRRIRHRRRGYGRSDGFTAAPTIERHAHDALALLNGLGVSRAHVVAHSGGGPIAVQLAADAPEVVASLVLIEPALFTASTAAVFVELVDPLVEVCRAGEAAKAAHLWMRSVGGRRWRAEIEAHVPGAGRRAEADVVATCDGDVPAIGAWDFDAVRERLGRQPVLYVAGERSAAAADPAAALLRETVPSLDEAVIEGANHANVVFHPSAARTIADFLGKQP